MKQVFVYKRDGSKELFNGQKIIDAINKAFIEVDGQLYEDDTARDIADEIYNKIKKVNKEWENSTTPTICVTVENIQDWIEDYLMRSERRDVARAYIRFRYKREVARDHKNEFFKAFSEKLEARNVQNQNANVDEHSFGGRTGEAADVLTKQYALDYCVSKMARENHLNNEIYIHKLNCA